MESIQDSLYLGKMVVTFSFNIGRISSLPTADHVILTIVDENDERFIFQLALTNSMRLASELDGALSTVGERLDIEAVYDWCGDVEYIRSNPHLSSIYKYITTKIPDVPASDVPTDASGFTDAIHITAYNDLIKLDISRRGGMARRFSLPVPLAECFLLQLKDSNSVLEASLQAEGE